MISRQERLGGTQPAYHPSLFNSLVMKENSPDVMSELFSW